MFVPLKKYENPSNQYLKTITEYTVHENRYSVRENSNSVFRPIIRYPIIWLALECLRKWKYPGYLFFRFFDISEIFEGSKEKTVFQIRRTEILTGFSVSNLGNIRNQISEIRRNPEISIPYFRDSGAKFPDPGVNLGNILMRIHSTIL